MARRESGVSNKLDRHGLEAPASSTLDWERAATVNQQLTPKVPPIKTQGIKTKLVPFIRSNVKWDGRGKWVEPFLGSGAVLFNIAPERALAADTNEHIISFYGSIQGGTLTADSVRDYLRREGEALARKGQIHYYDIRERFNSEFDSHDFLFLNRACFNGLMRFNRKGQFNTPFCRKPARFRQAYITKICNQVAWVGSAMAGRDWRFLCADWKEVISEVGPNDFAYLDPPYIGRHSGYYNQWDEQEAMALNARIKSLPCPFLYSMWGKNKYRGNKKFFEAFSSYTIKTFEHFYHLGASESLRNPVTEALVVG